MRLKVLYFVHTHTERETDSLDRDDDARRKHLN